jgi:hypothetical protein
VSIDNNFVGSGAVCRDTDLPSRQSFEKADWKALCVSAGGDDRRDDQHMRCGEASALLVPLNEADKTNSLVEAQRGGLVAQGAEKRSVTGYDEFEVRAASKAGKGESFQQILKALFLDEAADEQKDLLSR